MIKSINETQTLKIDIFLKITIVSKFVNGEGREKVLLAQNSAEKNHNVLNNFSVNIKTSILHK